MERKCFGRSAILALAAAVLMSGTVAVANEAATNPEYVIASEEAMPANLRISGLIPDNWFHIPAVDPAIPADYEMWYDEETDNAYWGIERDLEQIAKREPLTIQAPVIQVAFSGSIAQTGPNSFSEAAPDKREFRSIGITKLKTKKMHWGDYPLMNITGRGSNGSSLRMAHLGLNTEEGWVMRFYLFTPVPASKTEAKATEKQYDQFWETFLTKTRQLQDVEACRAKGTDIQEGVTYQKIGPVRMKFIGERRRSDGHVAVFAEPVSEGTTFSLFGFFKQNMEFQWKHGAPGIQLFGVIEQSVENVRNTINMGAFVLLKDVDEHSDGESALNVFWPSKKTNLSVDQKVTGSTDIQESIG